MKNKKIKSAFVYPYSKEFAPILRYAAILKETEIKLAAPKAWALCDRDASFADGGPSIGIKVESNLDNSTAFDCLIVPTYDNVESIDNIAINLISSFIAENKNVYLFNDLLSQKVGSNENIIRSKSKLVKSNIITSKRLENIDVPVLVICGVMKGLNKIDIQMQISNLLSESGYKLANISSIDYDIFTDYYSYPSSMNDTNINYCDKVFMLNKYIKEIELLENPDLITIEIPEGIMPYSDRIYNNFGDWANVVFNSIVPEYTILCLPYAQISVQYLELLKEIMYYRFNCSDIGFFISNNGVEKKTELNENELNPIMFEYTKTKSIIDNIREQSKIDFVGNSFVHIEEVVKKIKKERLEKHYE